MRHQIGVGQRGAGGGALFIQPTKDGQRLDDVVGSRFLVVARRQSDLGSSGGWWREVAGAHTIVLEDQPHEALSLWLKRFGADVAVVRPDRYVLGSGSDLDQITEDVAGLLRGAGFTEVAQHPLTFGVCMVSVGSVRIA